MDWTNTTEKTYTVDQFKIDLWSPNVDADEVKFHLECQAGFRNKTEKIKEFVYILKMSM